MKHHPLPPVEELRKYYSYDPDTGDIIRVARTPGSVARVGAVVGYLKKNGYREMLAFGRKVYYHRVAWLLHTGEDPGRRQIDHINRVRHDNRACNLRAVSGRVNCLNSSLHDANPNAGTGSTAAVRYGGVHLYMGRHEDETSADMLRQEMHRRIEAGESLGAPLKEDLKNRYHKVFRLLGEEPSVNDVGWCWSGGKDRLGQTSIRTDGRRPSHKKVTGPGLPMGSNCWCPCYEISKFLRPVDYVPTSVRGSCPHFSCCKNLWVAMIHNGGASVKKRRPNHYEH